MTQSRADENVRWADLSQRLRRLALSLTRRFDEADDLTQETLAALLARSPEYAAHLGYARQTLVRRWLDQQRGARRRIRHWLALTASFRAWHEPRHALDDAFDIRRARQAIEALPPMQRAALALRVVEEQDYDQIAQILGCTNQAVRANLHQARRRLRQTLGAESWSA